MLIFDYKEHLFHKSSLNKKAYEFYFNPQTIKKLYTFYLFSCKMGSLRKHYHETFKLFKTAVIFFPQMTRIDKMFFLVPGKILNKMVLN